VKPIATKVKELRLQRDDFETLKIIGRGAFGEVAVVRLKDSEEVFAMKILNKWEMLKRAETACFKEERDVLVYGDKKWITNLHYAFQDDDYLYLVMDYYCGGDLLTLLSKFEDRLPEEMAKFYIAEMVLAIHSLHQLRYVHRDIKPDNVLLDRSGHIVLADFGSCLKLMDDGTVQSSVAVGTPDYISPEILRAMEDGHGRYGAECDWWSLGVCVYEMLFGETPFYAESLVETYGKIMNHENQLKFPDDIDDVSEEAKDLICRLITSPERRLGQSGIQDFIDHLFFQGINWENLGEGEAPYMPDVSSPTDTSNFDVDESDFRPNECVPPTTHSAFTGHHLPFVGFTFTKTSRLSDLEILAQGSTGGSNDAVEALTAQAYKRRIEKLERENKEITRKLQDATKVTYAKTISPSDTTSSTSSTNLELSKVLLENAALQRKIEELSVTEAELSAVKQELNAAESKKGVMIKSLEKSNKTLMVEKDEYTKEIQDLQEKVRAQSKELRDAIAQRKMAMDEFTSISDKLADMLSAKQKLSRQMREQEEEMEEQRQKTEALRQELRKSDKSKRELQALFDESQSEASKEKKLREHSEMFCNELEQELKTLKEKHMGHMSGSSSVEPIQEIARLKAEFERKSVEYEESLAVSQTRHSTELKEVVAQLSESEANRQSMETELNHLRDRVAVVRQEALSEWQDSATKMRHTHESQRKRLEEEVTCLTRDIKTVQGNLQKVESEKRRLEDELGNLQDKKDSVSHWETQISEIIQWVSDEKDARGYLQALATKMTEELEGLKISGVPTSEKGWKNRRSQRLDKMELLNLQSSLQSEIQAKQSVQDELRTTKAHLLDTDKRLKKSEEMVTDQTNEIAHLRDEIKLLRDKLEGEGYIQEAINQSVNQTAN